MMNNIYLKRLNRAHSYGMRLIHLAFFLPKEAFLTECEQWKNYDIKAALPSAEKLQNELLNFEREHKKNE